MNAKQQVSALRRRVSVTIQEMDWLIQLHETWRPAAFDSGVIQSMGTSYATNAFNVISMSLRREVFVGIRRLWDEDKNSIGLPIVLGYLKDAGVIEELASEREAAHREAPINLVTSATGEEREYLLQHFRKQRAEDAPNQRLILYEQIQNVVDLIEENNGPSEGVPILGRLKKLRDKLLAHRDVRFNQDPEDRILDEEVETLYLKMIDIMKALRLAVENASYDPSVTARHYRDYAEYFWDSVCGESNARHRRYRYSSTPNLNNIC